VQLLLVDEQSSQLAVLLVSVLGQLGLLAQRVHALKIVSVLK
jgi:hypothetical protein